MIDPQNLRLLEALLFASAEPVGEEALKKHFPEGIELEPLVEALTETYAPRGVNVIRVAGGLALRTAPDLAPRLQLERTVTRRLSRAAIETLAIVAYHQPVTRAEIEEIRGVVLGKGTLDALMEQGWIKPGKRRETPGRPVTWNTTEQFLLHFGLEGLRDLPGLEELKASGLLDAKPTSLGETSEAVAEPSEAEVEPNEFAPAPDGEGVEDARTETAGGAPAEAGDKTA
jgi:segregation and condensation protein B